MTKNMVVIKYTNKGVRWKYWKYLRSILIRKFYGIYHEDTKNCFLRDVPMNDNELVIIIIIKYINKGIR